MSNNSTDTVKTGDAPADKQSRRLSPKAAELLQDRNGALPCWVRSPKTGVEFFSGFSRAKLYELAGKNLIRSVSIREPGAVKGTRLFHLASILAYIERCEAEANAASAAEKGKEN